MTERLKREVYPFEFKINITVILEGECPKCHREIEVEQEYDKLLESATFLCPECNQNLKISEYYPRYGIITVDPGLYS